MHGQSWSIWERGAIAITAAPWASGRGTRRPTAEQRLMVAVLEDAIRELTQSGAAAHGAVARRRREIVAWFASDDVAWPFSFLNVCQALDLAPARLRARLGCADPAPPPPAD